MAIESNTDKLERVQALIREIESTSNQQTSVNGRSFAKHDLEKLYDRERELIALVKRDAAGGLIVQQVAPL